jgi:hypothetical protein
MIYRFKVTFEDDEEIYREIEIKSTQNFEEFHYTIIHSIGFDNNHHASFFISDDYWRKGDEITLRNDSDNKTPQKAPLKGLMSKFKLAALIDDPHQKFVYIYDIKTAWTFLIELVKIVPIDAKAVYPKVSKSVGESPKQYKTLNGLAPIIEDEEFDEEEGEEADDEAYTHAHDDDETALLEGEEGETEEEEEGVMDDESEDFDASEFEHSDDEG